VVVFVKGLCDRCFICLRPLPSYDPFLPSDPILLPLHTVYVYTVYLFTKG
jgi:hypothetical protein